MKTKQVDLGFWYIRIPLQPKPDNQEPSEIEVTVELPTASTEPKITSAMVKEKYARLRRNYTNKGYRYPQGVDSKGKYLF